LRYSGAYLSLRFELRAIQLEEDFREVDHEAFHRLPNLGDLAERHSHDKVESVHLGEKSLPGNPNHEDEGRISQDADDQNADNRVGTL